MFEDKKQAFLKSVQHMILSMKVIEQYVPAEEQEEYLGSIKEAEDYKATIEATSNLEELDELI